MSGAAWHPLKCPLRTRRPVRTQSLRHSLSTERERQRTAGLLLVKRQHTPTASRAAMSLLILLLAARFTWCAPAQ